MANDNMTSTYTPGPWHISKRLVTCPTEGCKGDGFPIFNDSAGMVAVAVGECGWKSEAKANARLIAAAPDLLVVATGLLKMFYPYGEHMDSMQLPKYTPTSQEWIRQARAAIEKATNGQNIPTEAQGS